MVLVPACLVVLGIEDEGSALESWWSYLWSEAGYYWSGFWVMSRYMLPQPYPLSSIFRELCRYKPHVQWQMHVSVDLESPDFFCAFFLMHFWMLLMVDCRVLFYSMFLMCNGYDMHRCFLGVELLKCSGEGSDAVLKSLWHHSDAIMCCSLKVTYFNDSTLSKNRLWIYPPLFHALR